jgi:hypothetical protein
MIRLPSPIRRCKRYGRSRTGWQNEIWEIMLPHFAQPRSPSAVDKRLKECRGYAWNRMQYWVEAR